MADIKKIASYLVFSYEMKSSSQFDNSELKLQKLMYLAQRESLALTNEPLFEEKFLGWQYGPVLPELRFFFEDEYTPFDPCDEDNIDDKTKYIIDNVVAEYGKYEAWALAEITHKDISWINSRKGLSQNQHGFAELSVEDIRKDSAKVKLYDHIYDMYLDDFEPFEGEVLHL